MTITNESDPVAVSVAAYSDHLEAYTAANAGAAGDLLSRFSARVPEGGIVLDAGCGPGRDLVRFAEAGFCVRGIDLNDDFVAAATAATDGWGVQVTCGDLRALPYDDDQVDAVWALASLVHLDTDDAAASLRELARVCRPGGTVLVAVKTGAGNGATTGWADTAHGRRWFRMWDPAELAAVAAVCGLDVTGTEVDGAFVNLWATAR